MQCFEQNGKSDIFHRTSAKKKQIILLLKPLTLDLDLSIANGIPGMA